MNLKQATSLASAALMLATAASIQAQSKPYSLIWDDFKNGFTVNSPTAKWFHFGVGPYVGTDGVATLERNGIRIAPPATNPITGLPAFSLTLGQETDAIDNPFGLPGGVDHVKWLVYANHNASSGYPGFDAEPGRVLSFDVWISGRSFGNEQHPFGAAVVDPDDDIRLACPAVPTIDFENFLVADFFITNKKIYALYERLPFGRTAENNYAAFTYAVPVADRSVHQQHRLTIDYDRSMNTYTWRVDGTAVMTVDKPGYRLPSRQHMIIDHGGVEEEVWCRQRSVGLGMFTLLDAAYPGTPGLAKLSVAPDFYFATAVGAPVPQTFVDNSSLRLSRQWGAGAEMRVNKVRVSSH